VSSNNDEGTIDKALQRFRKSVMQRQQDGIFLTDPVIGADEKLQRRFMDVLIRGEDSTAIGSCASECVKKGR